nr:immunoglobulin heavy chain junction region [Macaca mulatta]MOW92200.1 immunoglobulin heavy chain junction region [Macaca mulatta]
CARVSVEWLNLDNW